MTTKIRYGVASGILVAVSVMAGIVPAQNVFAAGTTVNVGSCQDLVDLASAGAYQEDTINLTADIDCTGTNLLHNDSLFSKVDSDPFMGTLNGNGHSITGIALTAEGGGLGLFGFSDGATFENLTLKNFDNAGTITVGGLVGVANNTIFRDITLDNIRVDGSYGIAGALAGTTSGNSLIENVQSTNGEVIGNQLVGGLVGEATDTIFRNNTLATTTVTAEGGTAGGLVGKLSGSGTIENAHSTNGVISGGKSLGGLVGHMISDRDGATITIRDASVTGGSVMSTNYSVGGLVGFAETGQDGGALLVEKVYTDTTVEATNSQVGGLFGEFNAYVNGSLTGSATLRNAYSWSSVSAPGSPYVGGLIGLTEVSASNGATVSLAIENTYASGTVEGANQTGGLIGYFSIANSTVSFNNNFAMGETTGGAPTRTAGLIGRFDNDGADFSDAGNHYDVSGLLNQAAPGQIMRAWMIAHQLTKTIRSQITL